VGAVETAVTPVLGTVTQITDGGVISPIVDTTVDVVGAVPVVGGVVSALGVDTAASSVGSSLDGVLQGTTDAVTHTVTGTVGAASGAVTSVPASPTGGELPSAAAGALSATLGAESAARTADPLSIFARAAYLTGALALAAFTDLPTALGAADSAFAGVGAAEGALALLRAVLQADSALIGPGGAGPGAWVLVALGFVVAYRAWVRRSGLENDVAPAAPTLSTDVSPD
jgi:hypothetical protein